MDDYAIALGNEDYPNAIAIWDTISGEVDRFTRETSGDRYNPCLPAIFSSFMPKSGGTYLYNRMINNIGYVQYYWAITHLHDLSSLYPTNNSIKNYSKGGYFSHTHAWPTPYFRMIMDHVDVGPIWVHIRHPAEACLAAYFHYQGEGQGDGEIAAQRISRIEEEKEYLRNLHGFHFDDWPAFFRQSLSFYSNWISAWLDYEQQRPGSVLFTYFDELDDLPVLLTRVFQKYGHTPPLEKLVTDHLPDDRRRRDGSRDWRDGLTDEDIASQAVHLAVWDRALALRAKCR